MNEDSELLPRRQTYGATSETDEGEEEYETQSYGDDTLDDQWNDDSDTEINEVQQQRPAAPKALLLFWNGLKNALRIIANVENLWDTDNNARPDQRRRNHMVVLFWFFILALSYAGERTTFKLLVDRTAPFRLLTVEAVTAAHALILGVILLLGSFIRKETTSMSLGIPLVDVGFMALLDTVCLLLVFVTGYRVTPTLTVILVQFTLPLTAFLTQFVHPDGFFSLTRRRTEENAGDDESNNDRSEALAPTDNGGRNRQFKFITTNAESSISTEVLDSTSNYDRNLTSQAVEGSAILGAGGLAREHIWGSLILFLAVLFALIPAFSSLIDPATFVYADPIPTRTAINTLLYASSCIPAAAVTLYKEHVFLQHKQPVNMNTLNLLLSIFQFIIASVLSPLLFGLQGLGAHGDWMEQYPSSQFGENYSDGLKCFVGALSQEDQEAKYPESAACRFSLLLVLVHVLSMILVGLAVDKIVNAGATKVMYRGVSAGIIVSVLCMHFYDMHIPDFNYGPAVDGLNLLCVILLILGAEVYHRVAVLGATFETEYAPIENIYEPGT